MASQKARLVDYSEFRQAVKALCDGEVLQSCEGKLLAGLDGSSQPLLRQLYQELSGPCRIMASDSFVVGSSKLLHHLLPDLFPPVDRKYTLAILSRLPKTDPYRIGTMQCQHPDDDVFVKAMLFYGHVARSVPNLGRLVDRRCMSTSIPKVLDNAMISWCYLTLRAAGGRDAEE